MYDSSDMFVASLLIKLEWGWYSLGSFLNQRIAVDNNSRAQVAQLKRSPGELGCRGIQLGWRGWQGALLKPPLPKLILFFVLGMILQYVSWT
jgi:hypothetical protein